MAGNATAEILKATDLLALIQETVRLKKQGEQWYGLCPFHRDTSPTLRVNHTKALWYCPACQIGGDAINWLKHLDHIPFRDAANALAVRAGLDAAKLRQDAPQPVAAPKEPKFPHPRQEPNLAFGGLHLARLDRPFVILNDFPGRRRYVERAERLDWADLIWYPRLPGGVTAGAERMDVNPIARVEVWLEPPSPDSPVYAWECRRVEAMALRIADWRRFAKAINPE